jgi:HEAT repeat protein
VKHIKGKLLTAIALEYYGVKRKRWFWFFRESDAKLRARCRAAWGSIG